MRHALLFVHVAAAAAWIGGGLFATFALSRMASSGITGAGAVMAWITKGADRYFGPAAGLTLLSGITLVLTSEQFGWGDAFVIVGLGAFLFSALWQPLVAGKGDLRLVEAVESQSPDTTKLLGAFRRNSAVEMAIILVALWAMVVKLGA